MKQPHAVNTVSKVQLPTNWHLRTNQTQRAYLPPTPLLIIKRLLDTPHLFCFLTTVEQPQWAKTSTLSRIHYHTQTHYTR